jgi:hypothetical protein
MQTTSIVVVLFLIVGIIVLSFWSYGIQRDASTYDASPGQYPIDDVRYEWPVKERRRTYRPTSGMGSDAVVGGRTGVAAAPKVVCALSDTCPEAL